MIDDISRKVQDLVGKINDSRTNDQKLMDSFQGKLVEKVPTWFHRFTMSSCLNCIIIIPSYLHAFKFKFKGEESGEIEQLLTLVPIQMCTFKWSNEDLFLVRGFQPFWEVILYWGWKYLMTQKSKINDNCACSMTKYKNNVSLLGQKSNCYCELVDDNCV